MSVSNFVPKFWGKELNYALRALLVGLTLVNTNWEGEIKKAGDTVYIHRPSAVNVSDYNIGSDITFQTPTSSRTTLTVDQQKYFAITLDDIEMVQSSVDLMPEYTDEGIYALADALDSHIFGRYTGADASNVIAKQTLSSSNIWTALTDAKAKLSKNNVPHQGRFIVLSPDEIALLERSTEFQRASNMGDETSRNGFVGRAAGFDVFESNNLVTANDGSHNVRHCVFGTRAAITFAHQMTKIKAGEHEKGFSEYVKGLWVYGSAVVKPKALGDLRAIVA